MVKDQGHCPPSRWHSHSQKAKHIETALSVCEVLLLVSAVILLPDIEHQILEKHLWLCTSTSQVLIKKLKKVIMVKLTSHGHYAQVSFICISATVRCEVCLHGHDKPILVETDLIC